MTVTAEQGLHGEAIRREADEEGADRRRQQPEEPGGCDFVDQAAPRQAYGRSGGAAGACLPHARPPTSSPEAVGILVMFDVTKTGCAANVDVSRQPTRPTEHLGRHHHVRRFERVVEDFVCGVCGLEVGGDGYTNHCPGCLWSRHVDEQWPGDRQADCRGLMEPLAARTEQGEFAIIHRCRDCGLVRRNKAADDDDHDLLIALTAHPAPAIS